jgi:transcriptional regulator with XRE-family HTH domain
MERTITKMCAARRRAGLTQESLEAATGATQSALSKLERKPRPPRTVVIAIRVARALNSTVEALWGEAADEQIPDGEAVAERTHGHTRRRPVVHTTND